MVALCVDSGIGDQIEDGYRDVAGVRLLRREPHPLDALAVENVFAVVTLLLKPPLLTSVLIGAGLGALRASAYVGERGGESLFVADGMFEADI